LPGTTQRPRDTSSSLPPISNLESPTFPLFLLFPLLTDHCSLGTSSHRQQVRHRPPPPPLPAS
jgi:hypothetical protein